MIEISHADDSLEEALQLQLQTFPDDERSERIQQLLESAREGVVSLEHCLICRRGDRLDGVLLLVSQTDGTIYVWPPETRDSLHPDDDSRIRQHLYEAAIKIVDAPDIWIGQSLLETDRLEQSSELSANGFPRLTDLVFMNHSVKMGSVGSEASSEPAWRSEPFDEAGNASEFASLVEQTYRNTCDCPELNGARNGWESLESHRQAGTYDPARWRLFRHGRKPAGLLLLTEHPPEAVWEVVYFGVAPEFRGMGFGKRILRAGIELAKANGIQEIVLAVDIRNQPAIRLYQQLDFSQFDRRIVHARLCEKRGNVSGSDTATANPNR